MKEAFNLTNEDKLAIITIKEYNAILEIMFHFSDGTKPRKFMASINDRELVRTELIKLMNRSFFLKLPSGEYLVFINPEKALQKIKNDKTICIINSEENIFIMNHYSTIFNFIFRENDNILKDYFKNDRDFFIGLYQLVIDSKEIFSLFSSYNDNSNKNIFYETLKSYFEYFTDEKRLLLEVL